MGDSQTMKHLILLPSSFYGRGKFQGALACDLLERGKSPSYTNLLPNDPLHSESVAYFRSRICMLVQSLGTREATNEAAAVSLYTCI